MSIAMNGTRNSCGAAVAGRDERARPVGAVHRAALLLTASVLRRAEHFALHEPLGEVRLAHEVGAGRLVARGAHFVLSRAEQRVAVEAAEARLVVDLLVAGAAWCRGARPSSGRWRVRP